MTAPYGAHTAGAELCRTRPFATGKQELREVVKILPYVLHLGFFELRSYDLETGCNIITAGLHCPKI